MKTEFENIFINNLSTGKDLLLESDPFRSLNPENAFLPNDTSTDHTKIKVT
jgi:hypothetical protein